NESTDPFLDPFVLVGSRHNFQIAVEVIEARAGAVVTQGFVKVQVALPGKAADDQAFFGISPVRQRLRAEQFGELARGRLAGKKRSNHAVKLGETIVRRNSDPFGQRM